MEIDQTNGVGTLIVPGDHVDIILTVYVTRLPSRQPTQQDEHLCVGGQQPTSKMLFQKQDLATLLPAAVPVAPPAAIAGHRPRPRRRLPSPASATTASNMIVIVQVKPDQAE